MKIKLLYTIFLLVGISFTSCNEQEKKEVLVDNGLKKVSLNIEGMTCEIGCARTIQSRLSKMEGVKFAEVHFDDKTGLVEFESGKVSEKQIVAMVEQIAGGDLYKVKGIKPTE